MESTTVSHLINLIKRSTDNSLKIRSGIQGVRHCIPSNHANSSPYFDRPIESQHRFHWTACPRELSTIGVLVCTTTTFTFRTRRSSGEKCFKKPHPFAKWSLPILLPYRFQLNVPVDDRLLCFPSTNFHAAKITTSNTAKKVICIWATPWELTYYREL